MDLNQAIRLDANSAVAHASRGVMLRRDGDLNKAVAELGKAIQLTPGFTARILPWAVLREEGQ